MGRCAGPRSSCRLSGEVLTSGPLRSTAARAEEQHAGVAIFAAAAAPEARATMGCPLRSIPPQVTQARARLGQATCCCCCFRRRLTRQRCLCRHNCTIELADPVPSHLGVRLPATPAPPGALDDEELFIVEGSKNWRSTPGQPEEREK